MEISYKELRNLTIIILKDEFFVGNVVEFEAIWQAQIEKKPKVVAIDCKDLVYIDSSAIGTLVKCLNNGISKGIELQFFDLNLPIKNIFAATRLDRFFNITTREKLEKDFL